MAHPQTRRPKEPPTMKAKPDGGPKHPRQTAAATEGLKMDEADLKLAELLLKEADIENPSETQKENVIANLHSLGSAFELKLNLKRTFKKLLRCPGCLR